MSVCATCDIGRESQAVVDASLFRRRRRYADAPSMGVQTAQLNQGLLKRCYKVLARFRLRMAVNWPYPLSGVDMSCHLRRGSSVLKVLLFDDVAQVAPA